MNILLPDFNQSTFESEQPIDNQYFHLTPGTVKSYQGQLYNTGEIKNEIGEEIVEKLGGDESDEVEEGDLVELADDIKDDLEDGQ